MNIIWLLKRLNLRTVIVNFKLLPLRRAIRFPVLIGSKTKIKLYKNAKFDININDLHIGMIRIGFTKVGIVNKESITNVEIKGTIVFKGKAYIGKGSKVSVLNGGILELGNNFTITAASTLICADKITIGDDCLFSWGITISDTDFHKIYDNNNCWINPDKPVIIGDKVWVGFDATILKGVKISCNSVISAKSLLTSGEYTENHIIAGNPGKAVKEFKYWEI